MSAVLGYGTTFEWNGNVVAQLSAINGVEISTDMVDVTTHQSADYCKEIIPGLIDPGEISLEGNFDASDTTGQHAMLTDFNARTSRACVITFPAATGAVWSFIGYVTNVKIGDAPVQDKIGFSATIKPITRPVFTVVASTGLTTPFFVISESAVVTPAAAGDAYTYVATVLTGISSVTVTPTATAGTITVNGSTVATGVASGAITLGAAGSVTLITIIVTETGKSPKTYKIYLSRATA